MKLFGSKRSKSPVREYLYIDENRLNAYVYQLRDPLSYDKVPVLSAEFGLSGPVAKAQQTRAARAYTVYEQLEFLESQLRTNRQLVDNRWSGNNNVDTAPFRVESCLACRVVVTDPASAGGDKTALWVSRFDPKGRVGRPTTLVLFEAVRSGDDPAEFLSTYSWLVVLLMKAAPTLFSPANFTSSLERAIEAGRPMERLSAGFTDDPIGFLAGELRAQLLPERSIRTFYRVRSASVSDAPRAIPVAVTLAYAISISETSANSLLHEKSLYNNQQGTVHLSREELEEHISTTVRLMKAVSASPQEIEKFIKNTSVSDDTKSKEKTDQ